MKAEKTTIEGYQTALVVVFILSLLGYYLDNSIYYKIAGVSSFVAMVWVWPFTRLSVLWFGLGHCMGLVMSKVMLSIVFFAVITPMGFLFRIFKGDTMLIRRSDKSIFLDRTKQFVAEDLKNPF